MLILAWNMLFLGVVGVRLARVGVILATDLKLEVGKHEKSSHGMTL